MCLSTTLEKETERFEKLALKLKNADTNRENRVARKIVSVLGRRYHLAEKENGKENARKSANYKLLIDNMRDKLIPILPTRVQYRVWYS